jgi:hypothetical protein
LEQEINPKTPPVELKPLPPGLQYVFPNGDRETPVTISDKLSHEKTQKLVATFEKYRSVWLFSPLLSPLLLLLLFLVLAI